MKNSSYSYIKSEEEKNPTANNPLISSTKSFKEYNKTTSFSNPLYKSATNFYTNRQKETDDCRQKLSTIVTILPDLKRKYLISLEQKMSYEEFMNVLKKYDISYPKNVIISLLNFIEIPNINSFSLKDFDLRIKA